MSERCEVTRRQRRYAKKSQGLRAQSGLRAPEWQCAACKTRSFLSKDTCRCCDRRTTSTSTSGHRLQLGHNTAEVPTEPVRTMENKPKGAAQARACTGSAGLLRFTWLPSVRYGHLELHVQHKQRTHAKDILCRLRNFIDSVPSEIFNALEATRSASTNRAEELADRVSRDTTITKQQIHLATRMMLEQVSRLSDGDYEQSMMVQLFLDCVDRATAFVFVPRAAHAFQRKQDIEFTSGRSNCR